MALVLSFGLAATLLAGCFTSNNTPQQESRPSAPTSNTVDPVASPLDIVVSESTYYIDSVYGRPQYVAILENLNTDYLAEAVEVTITAKDAQGVILNTTSNVTQLFPNQKRAVCGSLDTTGEVAEVEFEVTVSEMSWSKSDIQGAEADAMFEITNINEVTDSSGSIIFTGEITNNLEEEVNLLSVIVTTRDASGTLVSGHEGYVSSIPAGGTAAFTVDMYGGNVEHASYEAYHSYMLY